MMRRRRRIVACLQAMVFCDIGRVSWGQMIAVQAELLGEAVQVSVTRDDDCDAFCSYDFHSEVQWLQPDDPRAVVALSEPDVAQMRASDSKMSYRGQHRSLSRTGLRFGCQFSGKTVSWLIRPLVRPTQKSQIMSRVEAVTSVLACDGGTET